MASTYTYPGVYVEEIPSGVRPIAGVSTSNTAFVDFFDRGPVDTAMRIDNLGDLDRIYGGLHTGSEASYALQQYFLNGGATAFAVRVLLDVTAGELDDDGTPFDAIATATISLPIEPDNGLPSVTFTANSPGSWGNRLHVGVIYPPDADAATFSVTIREYDGERQVATENFDNVNTVPNDPSNIETAINGTSTLVTVKIEAANTRPQSALTKAMADLAALESARPAAVAAIAGAEANAATLTGGLAALESAVDTAIDAFVDGALAASGEMAAHDAAVAASAAKIKDVVDGDATVTQAQADFDQAEGDYTDAKVDWEAADTPDAAAIATARENSAELQDAIAAAAAASAGLDKDLADNEVVALDAAVVAGVAPEPLTAEADTMVTAASRLRTATDALALAITAARPSAELNSEVITLRQAEAVAASALAAAGATARAAAEADPAVIAAKNAVTVRLGDIAIAGQAVLAATTALDSLDTSIRIAQRATNFDELGDLGRSLLTNLTSGSDGIRPGSQAWKDGAATAIKGAVATSTGVFALNQIAPQIFNIMCIPAAAALSPAGTSEVYATALTYCKDKRAFLIVDPPEVENDPLKVAKWTDLPRDKNAAVFFPRITIGDPLAGNAPRQVASSGTMAGVFARIDADRGVFKAPAGTATSLRGTSLTLTHELTDKQNGVLNSQGINVLRNFPIYNNISWGARTLVGADAQASEWKYIPVRRTALFIEESLFQGLKWVVFEPNDEPLWGQLRLNVGAFMHGLFRQGAFQGTKPNDAYLVKCDSETTTQNDINAGVVNLLVGFAPLKPAEFVVIKIKQLAGQVQA